MTNSFISKCSLDSDKPNCGLYHSPTTSMLSLIPRTMTNHHFGTNSILPIQPVLKNFHPLISDYCNNTSHEDPKPNYSYIGLISMAILSTKEKKMVLSDIYQWIQDHYTYFQTRGPGWRNSIRHNLSLNDCFIKVGRSSNGKGHYWGIHPANLDDFVRGDFRRRRAQRKVRKALGLACPDEDDTPSPSPMNSPKAYDWNFQTDLEKSDISVTDQKLTNFQLYSNSETQSYSAKMPLSNQWSAQFSQLIPKVESTKHSFRSFDIDNILSPTIKRHTAAGHYLHSDIFFSKMALLNLLNGIKFSQNFTNSVNMFRESHIHQIMELKKRVFLENSVEFVTTNSYDTLNPTR